MNRAQVYYYGLVSPVGIALLAYVRPLPILGLSITLLAHVVGFMVTQRWQQRRTRARLQVDMEVLTGSVDGAKEKVAKYEGATKPHFVLVINENDANEIWPDGAPEKFQDASIVVSRRGHVVTHYSYWYAKGPTYRSQDGSQ